MDYRFSDSIPEYLNTKTILISDNTTMPLSESVYVLLDWSNKSFALEIRSDSHCSPFKEVKVFDSTAAVGYEGYCYLFDLAKEERILSIKMDMYFGHLYLSEGIFYVADASSLHAVNPKGEILWVSETLGIDGVVVNKIDNGKIYGEGEWDPPGGWKDFTLDLRTGKNIK